MNSNKWVSKMYLVMYFLLLPFVAVCAQAGDIEWSGLYRVEGQLFGLPSLDSAVGNRKEYGVHTLILRPKIVAADGLYINGQLNILTEGDSDGANQLGDYFGGGLDGSPYSNSLSDSEKQDKIRLSQFYLTYAQENGSLIVGRAPQHFGLGMTHSAGRELYDHFADIRDVIGYKMILGNFYLFPMWSKIDENDISGYDDIKEVTIQLQYENPEDDTALGVYYQNRKSGEGGQGGNTDLAEAIGGAGATPNGNLNMKTVNIFYKKKSENHSVGFEISQQSGDIGVANADDDNMEYGGFGAAFEYEYHPIGKKTAFGFKAGYATGDDLSTDDQYEGFIFDRNYDVAMFLFNHGLGQRDLFHTRAVTIASRSADYEEVYERPDVEAISNVTYISPYVKYKWNDKWSMVGVLTTGLLDDDTVDDGTSVVSVDADLGYELDLSVIYTVSDKINWINQVGYFEPGKAWQAGAGLGNDSIFGFVSKAAVSF